MTENEKLAVERAREDYENDEVFVSNGSIGIEE